MARKQARRRKPRKAVPKITLPTIRWARLALPLAAVAIVIATYHVSARLLERPIDSVIVTGPFQRVTPLAIEEAVASDLEGGFLGADLDGMRAKIRALPWIDDAAVARRWPDRIAIAVTEQVPAAIWNGQGLLNTRGELFVRDLRHVPAELPRLSGPDDHSAEVARRYLAVREQLIPRGLDVHSVDVDARGAWSLTLANGVDIRFGRRDTDTRTALFVDVVAGIVTARARDIDYVDMRYGNGFAIGWHDATAAPGVRPADTDGEEKPESDDSMLALRGDR